MPLFSMHSCRLAIIVCLSLIAALPAGADPAQEARHAIQAAYAGMDKAISRRDTSAYAVYLDPDIVGIDEKGKETDGKAKTVQLLRQAFAVFRTAASKTNILTLALQGGGAVVTTHSTLSLSAMKNGRPIVVKSENQVRDFWSKSGGRWLLRQERVILNAQTLNGQPVRSASQAPGQENCLSAPPVPPARRQV